jgi:creatinine amidohydrolase
MNGFDDTFLISNMTWPEIQRNIDSGRNTIIVSVGSIEQHGPHLPIATDELLGTAMACRVAELLDNALVAPTIRPGFSPHHMGFAGSISLTHDTLSCVIKDYVDSLGRHGFENIVVLCSHGGNSPTIRLTCQYLQAQDPPYRIIPIYDMMQYACMSQHYFGVDEGFHANRIETAWMLYLYPELVQMEKAVADGSMKDICVRDVSVMLFHGTVDDISETGVLGDPRGASADLGRESFSELTKALADDIRDFIEHFSQSK